MSERQIKWEERTTLDLDSYTLGMAMEEIQRMIAAYGENAKINSSTAPYSDSDKEYLYIMTPRPENDEEYNLRMEQLKKYAEQREKHERAEFQRLQAKFGKV
jgi:hypothetical protein